MSNKRNPLSNFFLVAVFITLLLFSLYFLDKNKNSVLESKTAITALDVKQFNTFSLILTGDVMLGRNVMNESVARGDFTYPFTNVADYLRNSDIVFINLENPVVTGCPKIDSGFTFCSLPESVDGLLYAGIDVANLANNHTGNFGQEKLLETEKFLKEKGILITGMGGLAVKKVNGLTFGFLGFDFTAQEPSQGDYASIQTASQKVDKLIVAAHWGVEYEDVPRDFQREWTRLMVVNGADVIVGNHPHWVQGAECFENGESMGYTKAEDLKTFSCLDKDVPVYYSLGNFVFDQMWSEETKKGAVVKLIFENGKLVNQEVRRTYIRNKGQPEWIN